MEGEKERERDKKDGYKSVWLSDAARAEEVEREEPIEEEELLAGWMGKERASERASERGEERIES